MQRQLTHFEALAHDIQYRKRKARPAFSNNYPDGVID
jgi:hypothetical protein